MGWFSKKPKPSNELLNKLFNIAVFKESVPFFLKALSSGSGKLYVQSLVNLVNQDYILTISAGDNIFMPSISFARCLSLGWRSLGLIDERNYLKVVKYEPDDWEKLADITLDSAIAAYKEFLKIKNKEITNDEISGKIYILLNNRPFAISEHHDLIRGELDELFISYIRLNEPHISQDEIQMRLNDFHKGTLLHNKQGIQSGYWDFTKDI